MLWTDIIDPATLTGYARAALADYEATQGSFARWLPNREVADIAVRFVKGQNGLVNVANFRAYDAEIEIGKREKVERVMLELPALGTNIPVGEYEQLRARGGDVSDAAALLSIQNTTRLTVRAVSDAMELLRAKTLLTGRAIVDQYNFQVNDDFGRDPALTFTASQLWTLPATSRLDPLQEWMDLYQAKSGGALPGAMVGSRRVFRSLAAGEEFQTQLLNGGARNATQTQVQDTITAAGLPPFYQYNRQVSVDDQLQVALPDNVLLFLPAPVDPDDWEGTQLGSSFWGRTLSSLDADWAITEPDQPGIVTGVYRNPKPPMGIEVIADAIGEPVLANANLSMAVQVLA